MYTLSNTHSAIILHFDSLNRNVFIESETEIENNLFFHSKLNEGIRNNVFVCICRILIVDIITVDHKTLLIHCDNYPRCADYVLALGTRMHYGENTHTPYVILSGTYGCTSVYVI